MAMDVNTQMRLTGLATGLDTDAIIKNLGKVTTLRVDAVKREKQVALWRQESLRNTINMVSGFLKSSFNVGNPSSNFRSATAFAKFSYNISIGGVLTEASKNEAAKVVSVTASSDVKNYNQSVQAVAQLASKDTWTGDKLGLNEIKTSGFNYENFVIKDGNGDTTGFYPAIFNLSVDGVSRTINVGVGNIMGISSNQDFADAVNKEIVKQFGSDYAGMVKVKNGELTFQKTGSNVSIMDATGSGITLKNMGLVGGASTGGAGQKTISELFSNKEFFYARNDDGSIKYKMNTSVNPPVPSLDGNGNPIPITIDRTIQINGVSISVSSTDTIATLTSKINGSDAGATLNYDTAGDKFTLTSKTDGTASNVADVSGATAQFFEMLGFGKAVEIARHTGNDGNGDPIFVSDYKLAIGGVLQGGLDGSESIIIRKPDGDLDHTIKYENGKYVILDYDGDPTGDEFDNLLDALGDPNVNKMGTRSIGTNLVAVINGEEFVRQSNSFTYEGVTYTFNKTYNVTLDADGNYARGADGKIKTDGAEVIKINVNQNTAGIADSIKAFVEEYNKIIDHINDLISQKRDREYLPLSDDEKSAMKEEDIKAYEEKARMGILANDQELRKLLDQMRTAIYTGVEGVGLTMAQIGISTGGWQDAGRLNINEDKLNQAIEERYDDVVALFTKNGDTSGSQGIAQRLNKILNDAVGTVGEKGYLIKRAGTVNDATQFDNTITKQVSDYDDRISDLLARWYRQEANYYAMFARMETSMQKMQSQMNSLASIMGQQGGSK